MNRRIRIAAGAIVAEAELDDTKTADAIWEALPLNGTANVWGDEIYFTVPVDVEPENGREIVDAGDLAYWPPGKAFCIFLGPTPASRGGEIRPASPVNVFGRLSGIPRVFKGIRPGERIMVSRA